MNKKEFIEIVEDVEDVELLENSIDNNVVIKSSNPLSLLISILDDEYDVELSINDVIEYIRLNYGLYIIIIKFEYIDDEDELNHLIDEIYDNGL